jgi:hypothetical protein
MQLETKADIYKCCHDWGLTWSLSKCIWGVGGLTRPLNVDSGQVEKEWTSRNEHITNLLFGSIHSPERNFLDLFFHEPTHPHFTEPVK